MFDYKMVQIPPNIQIKANAEAGQEAARYLQEVVSEFAQVGWEFQRVDSIGVHVNPGCLGALGGAKATQNLYYVITFRREMR